MVRPPDVDTDFFVISRRSFSRRYNGSISIYNLLQLRSTNISRSNQLKWFFIEKKSRRYPRKTITDTD